MRNVVVIGGGIAGLISAIQLAKAGVPVTVIEKRAYPAHKVCGEYISNEALPFLEENGLFPNDFLPPSINRFQLSSVTGRQAIMPLDLGGFGISRFSFDHFLYQKAVGAGVDVSINGEVTTVNFSDEKFTIQTDVKEYQADLVIGAYGKRSRLDKQFSRKFVAKRSPYTGIKYHIRTEHPRDLIALHNFEGGYCGISNVEHGTTNLCYLTHQDNLRRFGDIRAMETEILWKNPLLKYIFSNSDFIFDRPEVINQISFETKSPLENHAMMVGDAAGMIAPLCGNGMAMAIHSAKIAGELATSFCRNEISRLEMENRYHFSWRKNFQGRLWRGRIIQNLFGNSTVSDLSVNLALFSKPVAKFIIRNTHGKPF